VLFRQKHDDDPAGCEKCPFCVQLPCLDILVKLSSHVGLLQAAKDPDAVDEDSKEHERFMREIEKAEVFLPEEIVQQLPGTSYVRSSTVMDDHFSLSGKMRVLDRLLKDICRNQGRVLLFSAKTQMLDIIENYIKTNYKFLRMDGSTPARKRQQFVDQFKKDPEILVFLLSIKAMGLGLNLTDAGRYQLRHFTLLAFYPEQTVASLTLQSFSIQQTT